MRPLPSLFSSKAIPNDLIVYGKGFGYADEPLKKRTTPETVYQWWSLTKPITAISVLQLMEQGKLNLEDSVEEHLAYFNISPYEANDRKIQIRDLLSHSSGLDDIGMKILGWVHYDDDPHLNQTELLKRILPEYSELKYALGNEGHYSNFGYIVLAAVIEKVSGMSYENYVRENVLKPLNMNNTDFIYTKSMIKNEATGSRRRCFRLHYSDLS